MLCFMFNLIKILTFHSEFNEFKYILKVYQLCFCAMKYIYLLVKMCLCPKRVMHSETRTDKEVDNLQLRQSYCSLCRLVQPGYDQKIYICDLTRNA